MHSSRPFHRLSRLKSVTCIEFSPFPGPGGHVRPNTELTVEKRPFYVTEDGKGKVVEELFA